jgi:hypothetical protein
VTITLDENLRADGELDSVLEAFVKSVKDAARR